jgi:hypothetical protein
MLRRTSKRVKEVVFGTTSFWDESAHGLAAEKIQFVLRQLTRLTANSHIRTLELQRCEMKGSAMPGQRVLQECWGSAQLSLAAISTAMKSELSGKEDFELLGVVKPLVFSSASNGRLRQRFVNTN